MKKRPEVEVAQWDAESRFRKKRRSSPPARPILSRVGAASGEAEAAVLHR
jgi:hypothetical protein